MPLLKIDDLKVDGVTLPAPKIAGFKVKPEKIWSENTGRSAALTMIGTILGIKTTIEIAWPPLTPEQVMDIESVASNKDKPFVLMEYTDQTGRPAQKTVYFGAPSYSLFDWYKGQWMVMDATVTAIEQ